MSESKGHTVQAVQVNGMTMVDIPDLKRPAIGDILNDGATLPKAKHEKVCHLLQLPVCVPNPGHKPYALRATYLEFFAPHMVSTLGGWHVCCDCGADVSGKPSGRTCPNCGCKAIKNFKPRV